MDDLRCSIMSAVSERKISLRKLSLMLGKNAGYFHHFVNSERKYLNKYDAMRVRMILTTGKDNGILGQTSDPVVNRVIQRFVERSAEGMERFGVSMEANDQPALHWIENAQEELMDGILYLEKLKGELTDG